MRQLRLLNQESKPVAVPPAPTGDALDILLDAVCCTIENLFKSLNRLHSTLALDQGQHSLMLTDGLTKWQLMDDGTPDPKDPSRCGGGVRRWIVSGTLRSDNELTPVLNTFLDEQRARVRLRRLAPDWKLTAQDVWALGKKFGLPGPPPPPTAEERAAQSAAVAEERKKTAVRRSEEKRIQVAIEVDAKMREHKKELLYALAEAFYMVDDNDFLGDTAPVALEKRRTFKRCQRDMVDHLIDQGMTDTEIKEELMEMCAAVKGSFRSTVPEPLTVGEIRKYVEPKELWTMIEQHDRDGVFEKYDMDICLAMDGRFCLTLIPKDAEGAA